MLKANWAGVLAPDQDWTEAYPIVADAVRTELDTRQADDTSTKQLAEWLWPRPVVSGNGIDPAAIAARRRLFKALGALAQHDLKDYATRGPVVKNKRFNRPVQHWRWHRFAPTITTCVCPVCGRAH